MPSNVKLVSASNSVVVDPTVTSSFAVALLRALTALEEPSRKSVPASSVKYSSFGVAVFTQICPLPATSESASACSVRNMTPPLSIFAPPIAMAADRVSPVNCGESPVPTPMLVRSVAPLSATGSVLPFHTIISLSDKTAIAVIAPVPDPSNTPPSVRLDAPVPPSATETSVPPT